MNKSNIILTLVTSLITALLSGAFSAGITIARIDNVIKTVDRHEIAIIENTKEIAYISGKVK